MEPNHCLACGACCAYYRASFYWTEADDATPGGVPVQLTQKITSARLAMRRTTGADPRCIALEGEIGVNVYCAIYPSRSLICRDFSPSWIDGSPNEKCDQARLAYGLQPLKPEDWRAPDRDFRPAA